MWDEDAEDALVMIMWDRDWDWALILLGGVAVALMMWNMSVAI